MIAFTNPRAAGFLPAFFSAQDGRSAREQLHENYAHGGGVRPFTGFILRNWRDLNSARLSYRGDPDTKEVSRGQLRDETIILFQYSWVAIVQPNGEHIITHCD